MQIGRRKAQLLNKTQGFTPPRNHPPNHHGGVVREMGKKDFLGKRKILYQLSFYE
jgi:hypothetical protein